MKARNSVYLPKGLIITFFFFNLFTSPFFPCFFLFFLPFISLFSLFSVGFSSVFFSFFFGFYLFIYLFIVLVLLMGFFLSLFTPLYFLYFLSIFLLFFFSFVLLFSTLYLYDPKFELPTPCGRRQVKAPKKLLHICGTKENFDPALVKSDGRKKLYITNLRFIDYCNLKVAARRKKDSMETEKTASARQRKAS